MSIKTEGPWFKDELGRTVILRGVNLGGSSKVPSQPDGATHLHHNFFNHEDVSFVGRPFPIEEAEEHFLRLRAWGFTFLRLLVTWEAVEHAGPGHYDHAYLEYLRAIVEIAARHEINVFIDPHQDVWSRFSGGDGAPGWTLEAVGFDITHFHETGAAILHQVYGDPFPRMIWPTNSGKLAAATMFSLFFGGNDFATKTMIAGEPAQEFLQRHYINSMVQVASALQGLSNMVGFDVMNEPLMGYISRQDLHEPFGMIKLGPCPSPIQSMLLGAGYPQTVDVWALDLRGNRIIDQIEVNPDGTRCWLPGFDCIWHENGVWDRDARGEAKLLRPDHFSHVGGRTVDFTRDYYRSFANRFARAIRDVLPNALIFLEEAPRQEGLLHWNDQDARDIVYAPHWYDGYVLFLKDFKSFIAFDSSRNKIVLGPRRIRRSFTTQLAELNQIAKSQLGNVPTLIGEIGIAFDMNHGRAYRTGNFKPHIAALDRSFRAIEDNLLNCTLWNYTADNDNQRGDQWNGEDFSIFSRDQQQDPQDIHSGGRALEAAVRPYPMATAGEPTSLEFEMRKKQFTFTFRHEPGLTAPTEIYIPTLQYPSGFEVHLSDGSVTYSAETQMLRYQHDPTRMQHEIRIHP
jgi:hypothetical protein